MIEVGWIVLAIVIVLILAGGYLGVVSGALPVDVNVGRRSRPLGPQTIGVTAPRELVFDVIAAPYLAPQRQAMEEKTRCWSVAQTWFSPPIAHLSAEDSLPPPRRRFDLPGLTAWISAWCADLFHTSSKRSS